MYPLLGLKKDKDLKPIQTYFEWENHYSISDKKLICIFKKSTNANWIKFEKEKLITHKNLDSVYDYENNIIYVFDLNFIGDDYDKIINGEYSKISDTSKNILCGYYGITTPEWIYIESYLYPSKYIKTYSEILNVDEDILWDAGELCDKPNMTKEKCIIKLKNE